MPTEHHIKVGRTARYYMIGEPSDQTRDVWFVCHGYNQLAGDFIREFETIADDSRVIVAPEALSRYYLATEPGFHSAEAKIGATWMTRADREAEIADYVAYLDDLYDEIFTRARRSDVSVTVVGFSQGGATANRWLTRGRARADRLIMWGALLATDSDLNDAASFFRDVKLTIVYGKRDQFADEGMIAKYEVLLHEKNVPYELVTFDGGHRMDRATLGALRELFPLKA
ncbi:MAG: dienelactone hydrolase family protein [Gemmatimonadota bacterium]|nr:dienelactone hydrolase family protein [Gemmatimonadota bacterium]